MRLPPNLYIIGTVNVDETTYTFSPKVLDRAFTIEFQEVDFGNYDPEGVDDDEAGRDGVGDVVADAVEDAAEAVELLRQPRYRPVEDIEDVADIDEVARPLEGAVRIVAKKEEREDGGEARDERSVCAA